MVGGPAGGALAEIRRHWHADWGDRRQELVFIGTGMDKAALRARLDAALAEGAEDVTPAAWRDRADPFPNWQRKAA